MVKIFSGYSKQGGSTEAFINLTNALNKRGHDTIFFGPHSYHLNKCKSGLLTQNSIVVDADDHVITHMMNARFIVKPLKHIYSCHEQVGFSFEGMDMSAVDKVHFVSKHQRDYHSIEHPHFIMSNVYDELHPNESGWVAGVVGLIYPLKQTHGAILKALEDGFKKVLVWGHNPDKQYFTELIEPLIDNERVFYMGHTTDKQKMFDSFSDLYLHSESECLPSIIAEAKLSGKVVHIPEDRNYKDVEYELDSNVVVNTWIRELGL